MSLAEYDRAGFGSSLEWGERPGVLVVDFCLAFTDPEFPLASDLKAELSATSRLLATARELGAPVVFTTQIYDASHPGSELWGRKSENLRKLETGTRWAELDPTLSRRPSEPLVEKLGASALFEAETLSLLREAGADTVLLCGATTSGCVRSTVVDLLQAGVPAIVVRDCVGDRSVTQHEASLVDMAAKYADVISADTALDYLRGSAWSEAPQPQAS
jgi:nicotinamidase-related amidase